MPRTNPLYRLRRACATAFAGICLLAGGAAADVLVLKDGTRLEGTIRRSGDGYSVTDADGAVTNVRADEVASLQITGGGNSGNGDGSEAQGPMDQRLASLRRSVENLSDLSLIIGKFERFVAQNKGTPEAAEAARDLAQWRQRLEQGMVKHGDRWVTPQERDQLLRQGFLDVSHARMQIKDGDLAAARRTLEQMLAADPQNVSALYLSGVIELRGGELGRAKALFEKVRASGERDHAPTLVNLAAINLEQNRHARALVFLHDAMNLAPGNREVLDNVAEALALLPEDEQDSRSAEQVRQLFLSQDAALRQEMAARGLYRWGSTWVNREQFEKLQEIEQEVEQRVAALDQEYRKLQDDVAAIELRLGENERFMQRLQSQRTYMDKDGKVYQSPLPPVYYETEREQQNLAIERTQKFQEMQRLEAEAQQQRQRYPTPPYKGHLQPIGEDGVPVKLPADAGEAPPGDAATRPATRPGE